MTQDDVPEPNPRGPETCISTNGSSRFKCWFRYQNCAYSNISLKYVIDSTSYGVPVYNNAQARSFDDAEPYFGNSKQTSKARGFPNNNLMKSFAPEKEKASSVAKIKVVVCLLISSA
ncbi:hypothetical protein Tco_0493548 [Tanacetum coccineum]